MIKRCFLFSGLVCASLAAGGCSDAKVSAVVVTPLALTDRSATTDHNRNLVKVEADITGGAGAVIESVVLRVFPVSEPQNVMTQNMTLVNGRYRVETLAVLEGPLSYQVELRYKPFNSAIRTTTGETEHAIPTVPAGCFSFDSSAARIWRTQSLTGCVPPISLQGRNFPTQYPGPFQFASFKVFLTDPCIRDIPNDVDQRIVSFLSPELLSIPGWEDATGFELQIAAPGINDLARAVQVQLLIIDQNGQERQDVDEQGIPVRPNIATEFFQPIRMTLPTIARPIRRVIIRMFVRRGTPIGVDGSLLIDRVCPLS